MIWAAIASELDLAAWKIDKLFKQRSTRSTLQYDGKSSRRYSPFSSS